MHLCRMIDGGQRTKTLIASFERVLEPLDRLLGAAGASGSRIPQGADIAAFCREVAARMGSRRVGLGLGGY